MCIRDDGTTSHFFPTVIYYTYIQYPLPLGKKCACSEYNRVYHHLVTGHCTGGGTYVVVQYLYIYRNFNSRATLKMTITNNPSSRRQQAGSTHGLFSWRDNGKGRYANSEFRFICFFRFTSTYDYQEPSILLYYRPRPPPPRYVRTAPTAELTSFRSAT